LIDKLVATISVPGLTVRADALNTFRRQFRLLLGNEIRQSLAYFGICEDPLAVLTGESPTCHARLLRPVKAVRIHKFVYSSHDGLFEWIL
jgi:hypothetical protein